MAAVVLNLNIVHHGANPLNIIIFKYSKQLSPMIKKIYRIIMSEYYYYTILASHIFEKFKENVVFH